MEPAAGGRDEGRLMPERDGAAELAAMEPAAGGRDEADPGAGGVVAAGAAMEPAAGGRDERGAESSEMWMTSRGSPQWSPPQVGGTRPPGSRADGPTTPGRNGARRRWAGRVLVLPGGDVPGRPQWSPPQVGGTRPRGRPHQAHVVAAMEPAAGGRDESDESQRAAEEVPAAMEPAAGGRDEATLPRIGTATAPPQWSPPQVGGTRSGVMTPNHYTERAAMEPAAGGRDEGRSPRPQRFPRSRRNGARRRWAGRGGR